jgi:hypothetical protein
MTTDKNFHIVWATEPEEGRNDAVWYYGSGCMGRAFLYAENGVFSLGIYCDGETLVKIPRSEEDLDDVEYVRYAGEFESMGIRNDDDLAKMNERWEHRDIWAHNSWFDLYTEEGEHIDYVTHEIPDAIDSARAVLEEVSAAGGWEKFFSK